MKRGRPFEPGNKYGGGRPPGSRNKKNQMVQELQDQYAGPLLRKAMLLALQGDKQLLRMFMGYILPRPKDPPVKTGPLRMGSIEDLAQTFEKMLKKVSTGQITLPEAQGVAALLEGRRRVIETQDLATLVNERDCREDPQAPHQPDLPA